MRKPFGHNFIAGDVPEMTPSSSIFFGHYPQTIATAGFEEHMEFDPSHDCYRCSHDDGYYIKLIATPYEACFRPEEYIFSNGEPVIAGAAYYFKLEPIEWIHLNANTGSSTSKLLLTRDIIDSQPFLEPQYVGKPRADGYPNLYHPGVDASFPNVWEYSTLRAWMNGSNTYAGNGFINRAFSDKERKQIRNVKNINDPNSSMIKRPDLYTWVFQRPTTDKIFCLSVKEASSHLFSPDPKAKDRDLNHDKHIDRRAEVTDYAIARGVYPYYIDGHAYGWWWLRSPGDPDQHETANYGLKKTMICQMRVCDVTEDGHICQRASFVGGQVEDSFDGSANGIRPALYIKAA